ncbi:MULTISPECIES: FAD binding domain-containing protein [Pseudomonas]|uniref:Xanthine dehydrogenase family protein subunit M n=1 Tax=Pseudomonas luteola TaxID=47886 RepID=A0ABS0FSF5_PSELU|nr:MULTISPECIES: xanthine dehydrogenase family protein subunit M [Pseudomonas]MBF8643214.1 xanthine dehydrogenase family protein subunit M [Pseudomonas zeshuii]
MKAAEFVYLRPASVAEAVDCLSEYAGEARVIAGGQSLMPMLNMRLWRLGALVDINHLAELARIETQGEETLIGALVRHASVETSPLVAERLPLLTTMIHHVGDRQVRNRGTLGGSLVQGDPTGEMPLGCLVLGARVRVQGPGGVREIAMSDFYDGSYAATLEFDEMLTEVVFPRHPSHHAFLELTRRHGDFCVLSVAVTGEHDADGCWHDLRIGLGGVNDTPVLAEAAAARLEGTRLADGDITEAAEAALAAIDPASDIRASAEYRAHLVPVYVRRALQRLRAHAHGQSIEGVDR